MSLGVALSSSGGALDSQAAELANPAPTTGQPQLEAAPDLDATVYAAAGAPGRVALVAWAGQRVVLEIDWRTSPGGPGAAAYDVEGAVAPADPAAGTTCVSATPFTVDYYRSDGPGNFIPSPDVAIEPDWASATVQPEIDQAEDYLDVDGGNRACISRVFFESENPGEVTLEAGKTDDFEATKVRFSIYYMKIESFVLSVVPATRPTGSGVASTEPLSGDDTTLYDGADWAHIETIWDQGQDMVGSLSRPLGQDVLLRGQVKGWFINANPSGRPSDFSNPLNVLPANRWVLPDDWAMFHGGGTASGDEEYGLPEAVRPWLDIATAPNNIGVIGEPDSSPYRCDTPSGGCSETLSDDGFGNPTVQNYDIQGPIEGPFSTLDNAGPTSAAISSNADGSPRNTILRDGDIDRWDVPMPPAHVRITVEGAGFIRQVRKQDVLFTGRVNGHHGDPATGGQDFTSQFYSWNIPDSKFMPPALGFPGNGYFWDSWVDGAYAGWQAQPEWLGWDLPPSDPKSAGHGYADAVDTSLTTADREELAAIRLAYGQGSGDPWTDGEAKSISRIMHLYTDNHGELMFAANGDFKLDFAGCDATSPDIGPACSPGTNVGMSTFAAIVDYPDFRGKHFPVQSGELEVAWLWNGYAEVTVERGATPDSQFIVVHMAARDGLCLVPGRTISLHPVHSATDAAQDFDSDPLQAVDLVLSSGVGTVVDSSSGTIAGDGLSISDMELASTDDDPDLSFAPLHGRIEECQAWVEVNHSGGEGLTSVLVHSYHDEGNLAFERTFSWDPIDANCDGSADAEDALSVLQLLGEVSDGGLPPGCSPDADMSGGELTILDSLEVRKAVAGIQ